MKQLPITSLHYKYVLQSFKEWLDILGYAETTVNSLPSHTREFLHYLEQQGKTQIADITAPYIRTHYHQLKQRPNLRYAGGLSNSYLNKHQQALTLFTDYLRQSGRLHLPALRLRREEKNTKKINVLTTEEISQLYEATYQHTPKARILPEEQDAYGSRDRAMLTVLYGCGLRKNEAYHLNLSDINFDKQTIHVRKGKNYKERIVPFNKTNAKYLQDYIYDNRPILVKHKKTEALFISRKYTRLTGNMMLLRLNLLVERTENAELQEKEPGLHTLRHSIATHLLQAGMKLENISRFLGHSSLESTQIYTHLIQEYETL